jgi:lipopolysaccharide biosynthesis glycosyltransferase
LFFTDYIKEDVERILYLDCDTIICSDLSELFETEMKNSPAAVVLDSLSTYYKKALEFDRSEKYFNSGVILFDVKNWKEQNCRGRIIETIRDTNLPLVNPDQDVLNLVLRNQKIILSPKYNFQTTHKVYSNKSYFKIYRKDGYYTETELEKASEAPVILHAYRFLGQFPWHKNAIHPWKELFWDYVKISEWKDLEPRENKGVLFAIERIAFKILPKTVFLFFFSKWQMYTFGKKIKELKKIREENKK